MRMTVTSNRFSGFSPRIAAAVLVVVAATILLGVLVGGDAATADRAEPMFGEGDIALYEAIVGRMEAGDDYYSAAATEQSQRGYPLRPAVVVREPTLALFLAALGTQTLQMAALLALCVSVMAVAIWRFRTVALSGPAWVAAVMALGAFGLFYCVPAGLYMHEVWAGLLMLAALLSRTGRHYVPSVLLALLAVSVRELALPLLAVMAFVAWRDRKSRELVWWLSAIVVFVAFYGVHAWFVFDQPAEGVVSSQGWLELGGWDFVLSTIRRTSVLNWMPLWVTAVVVPLALLGWASLRDSMAARVTTLLAVYFVTFAIVGRPENWYWGLLYVALIGPGLAFAPGALWTLGRRVINSGESHPASVLATPVH